MNNSAFVYTLLHSCPSNAHFWSRFRIIKSPLKVDAASYCRNIISKMIHEQESLSSFCSSTKSSSAFGSNSFTASCDFTDWILGAIWRRAPATAISCTISSQRMEIIFSNDGVAFVFCFRLNFIADKQHDHVSPITSCDKEILQRHFTIFTEQQSHFCHELRYSVFALASLDNNVPFVIRYFSTIVFLPPSLLRDAKTIISLMNWLLMQIVDRKSDEKLPKSLQSCMMISPKGQINYDVQKWTNTIFITASKSHIEIVLQ